MVGPVSTELCAIFEILLMDADGQRLQLESFEDLESARRRFPSLAAQYPGAKITLWNRATRAILAETEGY
jgi:hypothetical protein